MTALLTVAVVPMWLASATGFAYWTAIHALLGGLRND